MTLPLVSISGRNFIVNGQPHMFRGTNIQLTGLHHPESGCQAINAATFNELQTWNVNIIRPWLNMELACTAYGTWNNAFFTNITTMLDLAEARNIYVMPSMNHQYNLSPALGGTGLPSWMFSGIGSQGAGWDRLYKAVVSLDSSTICTQIRTALAEYYTRLMAVMQGRNVIMGYDIFNEPEFKDYPPYSKTSASYFYEAISDYISDTSKPQCVESNFVSNSYKPNLPNLFTSGHGYATHTFSYSLSQMKNYFSTSDYWVQGANWNVPTWNSEWFLATTSEASQNGWTATQIVDWYDRYCRAMDELGIGWQYLRTGTTPSNLHWATGVKAELLSWFALNEAVTAYTKTFSGGLSVIGGNTKAFTGNMTVLAQQYKEFTGGLSVIEPPEIEVIPKPISMGLTVTEGTTTYTKDFSGSLSVEGFYTQPFSGGLSVEATPNVNLPPRFGNLVKAFENMPKPGFLTIDGKPALIDGEEHRIDCALELFPKVIKSLEKR